MRQTIIGIKAVRDWSEQSGHLNEDDIFISGDVDEVLSRDAIHKLKWCQVSGPVLTGALWMPYGNFDRAMKSDFSVQNRPHTYGLPTIYSWSQVKDPKSKNGGRMQLELNGRREKYITGGIHMTNHASLPYALLKELTATEINFFTGFVNIAYLLTLTLEGLDKEQENLYKLADKKCWLAQADRVSEVTDIEPFIPWFLTCNPARYPYWFGRPDPRNQDLLESRSRILSSLRSVPQSYWEKSRVKKLFKNSIYPASTKSKDNHSMLICDLVENF